MNAHFLAGLACLHLAGELLIMSFLADNRSPLLLLLFTMLTGWGIWFVARGRG